MFQEFETSASPDKGKERVKALRSLFDALEIDGFLVPRSDAFQGEYIPDSEARLAWLTGFTGSAGVALIMRKTAHVFVDGRYRSQVSDQVDTKVFTPEDLVENPPSKWLKDNGHQGLRIGVDPWLHTMAEMKALEKAADEKDATIVRLPSNPIDRIWRDRPAPPSGKVSIQPLEYAGAPPKEKLAAIRDAISKAKADACVLTDPSSVAWTFNIRGQDVPHTPHPLAFAIIEKGENAAIFIDEGKLDRKTRAYLTQLADIRDPAAFTDTIADLASRNCAVMLDPALASSQIASLITDGGGKLVEHPDPARLPRAVKNETEIKGSRAAHRRDGAAMATFLSWLDRQQPGSVDEISAVKALEKARRTTGERMQAPLKDISFDTISGAGPDGAIIHYRVTTATNRKLEPGQLYLVDSGGQYVDGTTDITRTVAIGNVGDEEKRWFTLVLKGMISITLLRFPENTRGVDIDAFARFALWKAGGDYAHGTGHGVGSYLSVHEGPQSISRRGMQSLEPGMLISNEPGYYRDGAFGIRIENLVLVHEPQPIEGGDKPMLGFETLTLCPIDRRLILPALLDGDELQWLNAYHQRVRDELAPLVESEEDRDWLMRATEPIEQNAS